jgi:hypothetical protein
MWAHGTEPLESPGPDRIELATAGRDARWANHGRYARGRQHRALRRGRPGPLARWPLVVSRQAIARLLCSNGLPAGRDWRRRRHTDQLRDLVSCLMSK